VLVAPAIQLRPVRSAALTAALRDLTSGDFAWIVLTSPATVRMLDERIETPREVRARSPPSARAPRPRSPGGPGGSPARPGPSPSGAGARVPAGAVVCCAPAPNRARRPRGRARGQGWAPTRVDAYRTTFPRSLPAEARAALRAGEVDAITFTSASTVRGFIGALGATGFRGNPKVVCIGPVTAREAREHGLTVHAVANPHTTDGLIEALERAFTPRR
jgi:uroporphyrinogen-III synthase